MICVTLSKPTHEALIHQHHQVADQGVELVELRVDLMQQDPDVFRLIKNRPTPVVITCRRRRGVSKAEHSFVRYGSRGGIRGCGV